jgi:hypothetical protein
MKSISPGRDPRNPQLKLTKPHGRTEDSLMRLLLPITGLLVRGGIGIDELVYAAKRAYLQEAMRAITRQVGRTNISRLSVATGMTRKEVSALLSVSQKTGGAAVSRRSGQQRALRVLKGWLTDSRFTNRRGHPGVLAYKGGGKSFTRLVKLYGGDVTPNSVLRELERIEVIDVTDAGALRLRRSPGRGIEMEYKLTDLATKFEDFARAIIQSNSMADDSSFFGFRDCAPPSSRDAAYLVRRFSKRAAALLDDFQQWSDGRKPAKPLSDRWRKAARTRIGLGVYLLRSDLRSAHNARGSPGSKLRPMGRQTPST